MLFAFSGHAIKTVDREINYILQISCKSANRLYLSYFVLVMSAEAYFAAFRCLLSILFIFTGRLNSWYIKFTRSKPGYLDYLQTHIKQPLKVRYFDQLVNLRNIFKR